MNQNNIKLFIALKAFIIYNNKILILKESGKYKDGTNKDKYDVAGGRIKPGQNFKENLLREIKEETGLEVEISKPFSINEWRPEVNNEHWQIVGTFIECFSKTDKVILSDDHNDYLWIDPKDYKKYNLIKGLDYVFKDYLNK